jgi:hypothetical protein
MAGYLCHPCLPDLCGNLVCENLPGGNLGCRNETLEAGSQTLSTLAPESSRSVVGTLIIVIDEQTDIAQVEEVVIIAVARAYEVDRSRVRILRDDSTRRLATTVALRFVVEGAEEAVPGGVTEHFRAVAEELDVDAIVSAEEVVVQCEGGPCTVPTEEPPKEMYSGAPGASCLVMLILAMRSW